MYLLNACTLFYRPNMKLITNLAILAVAVPLLTVGTNFAASKLMNRESQSVESAPVVASAPSFVSAKIKEDAEIIKTTPHYTVVQVPHKNCHMVNQTHMVENADKNGTVGGVVGGTTGAVAGGVIGKQIGGNTAGTLIGGAVGLIGGAIAGNQIQKATQPNEVAQTEQVQHCTTTVKQVRKISGYEVSYTYQGRTGSVFMKNKPTGKYLSSSEIYQVGLE